MQNMTGKVVLITGASTGIGAATVRRARRAGWEVLATARREDRLKALAEEPGCEWFAADLTIDDEVAALAEKAKEFDIDSLVNNAGGARGVDKVEDGDLDNWQAMYDMNVLATLRLTKAIIPHFRQRGLFDRKVRAGDTEFPALVLPLDPAFRA